MHWQIISGNIDLILSAFWMTVMLSAVSWIIAIVCGIVFGLLRVSPERSLRLLSMAYVEFFRNIPALVIVFFVYFALPGVGISLSGFASAVIGVGLYGGAVMAETVRSGILSVPRGQYEAAIVSGMSFAQAMRYVVLPQAVRIVIPPLGTETITLIKNTSLAGVVAVQDVIGVANLVGSQTFAYIEMFIAAAIAYTCLTAPTAVLFNFIEKRFGRVG